MTRSPAHPALNWAIRCDGVVPPRVYARFEKRGDALNTKMRRWCDFCRVVYDPERRKHGKKK